MSKNPSQPGSPSGDDGGELPAGDDQIRLLVDRAHEGDADALNDLFARYHQTMVEVARRKNRARYVD